MSTLFPETIEPDLYATDLRPRPYQHEAIENSLTLWDNGTIGALVRVPTGCGKTLTAWWIMDLWCQRSPDHYAIVLCHERQLVQQFHQEGEDVLGVPVGLEMSNDGNVTFGSPNTPQFIVASRQSLYLSRKKCEPCGGTGCDYCEEGVVETSRLFKFDWRKKWLVVIDELHRYKRSMKSCKHIFKWFEQNPDSRRLGLTATPERTDKVSLATLTPGVAIDYPMYDIGGDRNALDDGWVVPFDQRFISVEGLDWRNVKEVAGDFRDDDLERVLEEEEALQSMIRPTLDLTEDRQTLIFCPTVAFAKNVARRINAMGRVASWLSGEVPDERRQDEYQKFERGDTQYLVVCGLCIAKGSLVLTDHGEVPIEDVTTDMRLWDGVEFVEHDGVLFKGVKPVIEYAGLAATEDHNVWTDDGWKSLAACKQQRLEIRVGGIEGAPVLESSGYYRGVDSSWQSEKGGTGGALHRLWCRQRQAHQRNQKVPSRLQKLFQIVGCTKLAADAVSFCKEAVREFKRQALRGLWGAGNHVQLCVPGRDGSMDHGQPGLTQGSHHRSHRERRKLRTGQHSLGQPDQSGKQQAGEKDGVYAKVEVYDILNAGPRHRFTANGLIVSNCREGYNNRSVSAIAIFRPTKSSPLAEQMKGRGVRPLRGIVDGLNTADERREAIASSDKPNCLIIDLVGATGLPPVATTAHLLGSGKPDEVIDLANEMAMGIDGPIDMAEMIKSAEEKIEQQRREAERREEERQKELEEQREAERRARLEARVRYSQQQVNAGSGPSALVASYVPADHNSASEKQVKFLVKLGVSAEKAVQFSKRQAGAVISNLTSKTGGDYIVTLKRHAGTALRDVPAGYIDWALSVGAGGDELRRNVEIMRRERDSR